MILKDVLKSVLMPLGVQFVMISGTIRMLVLYAIS